MIKSYEAKVSAQDLIRESYRTASDKRILEVPKGVVMGSLSEELADVLFLIYEDRDNQTWKAKCVTEESFYCRTAFPVSWHGLRGEELQKISNIGSAEFVHVAGFLAVAKTKEGIIEMCLQAINEN
jgi:uncharacterized UPF0160 family protein